MNILKYNLDYFQTRNCFGYDTKIVEIMHIQYVYHMFINQALYTINELMVALIITKSEYEFTLPCFW